MDFLKADMKHLFDDQGVDKSQYADKVDFRDPITKFGNLNGGTPINCKTDLRLRLDTSLVLSGLAAAFHFIRKHLSACSTPISCFFYIKGLFCPSSLQVVSLSLTTLLCRIFVQH